MQLDETGLLKVKRYALAAAGIHLLVANAVTGTGASTHFKTSSPEPYSDKYPFNSLFQDTRGIFMDSFDGLKATASTHFGYFIREYVDLSEEDPNAAVTDELVIRDGGNLPDDGSFFVELSSNVMARSPVASKLSAASQLAIAHRLIPVAIGRATRHIDVMPFQPGWERVDETNTELVQRGERYTLQHVDGGALFPIPQDVIDGIEQRGPRLICPAQQLLVEASGTALELGFHAVVNLGYDHGFYGPGAVGLVAPS